MPEKRRNHFGAIIFDLTGPEKAAKETAKKLPRLTKDVDTLSERMAKLEGVLAVVIEHHTNKDKVLKELKSLLGNDTKKPKKKKEKPKKK